MLPFYIHVCCLYTMCMVFTRYVWSLYDVCHLYTMHMSLHDVCCLYAMCMVFKRYVWFLHDVCGFYAIHVIFTRCMWFLYDSCGLCMMCVVFTRYVWSLDGTRMWSSPRVYSGDVNLVKNLNISRYFPISTRFDVEFLVSINIHNLIRSHHCLWQLFIQF